MLVGEELAGAADARLDFIKDQQQVLLVAPLADKLEIALACRVTPLSPCTGSSRMATVLSVVAAFSDDQVVEGHLLEAVGHRLERRLVLLLAGGGQGRQRAPVER